MRLWHYKLIPVLPNKMLVSQWRELIAIKRQWEKGSLKHRLVSYVMDYNKARYLGYAELIRLELEKRGIKYNYNLFAEIRLFCRNEIIFSRYKEHNDKYFKQCYYNLEEKHDRGIISDEEWEPINHLYWQEDDKGYY